MIILAATSNDKGKQLETLTMNLLRHRGYENCTTNVMANGAEIDVRGELPLPGLGTTRHQKLICECKAHKSVMDMTQWCKFLGKVFHQEACTESEVAGCFVSLSGVNGHVQGNYDELSGHRKNISLLHGDELLKLIAEIIPFIALAEISRRARTLTDRTASRFEPAYHNGQMFWIIVFSGGEFTILSAEGVAIEAALAAGFAAMVETELDVSSYIDIQQEAQARHRSTLAQIFVVATLFENDGSINGIDDFSQIDDFSSSELKDAAQKLIDEGHLKTDDDGKCSIPIRKMEDGDLIAPEIFRILFADRFPVSVLHSEFYQRHLNPAFINEVCKIQAELYLTEAEIEEILTLFRLSPSAVAQSLHPMQMIVTGRQQATSNQSIDRFHQDYFHQVALESLKRDFRNPSLAGFFHEHRGMRELETSTKLILKSEKGIEQQAEFVERVGIGRLGDSLGGGLAHIALLKTAPQPWDQAMKNDDGSEPQGSSPISDASVSELETRG
ncbi:restriction endonuclease [Rhodopirellula bahusiensis]|uniref:Restriction endonuclease type IV Mrr domain-containing protein n=1 Tax=Rhodopirellula bahusiensis TaxID=2014065 RepID=A0A2G1W6Z6_9BACT|nr:restriction endonuclease [Rhodopirellula bahusiensis]PHQ34781.1 hypothetical protein CEE69_12960 [Rhodopirellula bahusiensis]